MSVRDNLQIAVLVACHNRREQTLQSIKSLLMSKPQSWQLRFYIVDDGSTDGTAAALAELPISLKLIRGPGHWFWAHSMYQAEIAIDDPCEAILWMNDDIKIHPDGLNTFEIVRSSNPESVIIGQFQDPKTGALTYGGMRRLGRHPLRCESVQAFHEPICVDTMNGNFVLIPKKVSTRVGVIDGGFSHAYADMDFGYRVRNYGFNLVAVPDFVGECPRNATFPRNTILERLKALHSPKAVPFKSQVRFLSRHGGPEWMVYLVGPYVNAIRGKHH